ncbi:PD40 domain-containing protein [soil metagenome]
MPRLALSFLLLLITLEAVTAQGFTLVNNRNHPELNWQVAETEHFQIIYPARLAGIEAEAAPIAEESFRVLSENFGGVTFPARIRIYLSNEDEVANGTAYPIGIGFTTIWVRVNDAAEIWTGNEPWLRKVIAHELAHIFHFRATRSNIGLLQNLLAEPMPRDWAEGLAQYQTEYWDAQRGDRWLRAAVFEDRLAGEGTAAAGRLLYAGGNSRARFMAERFGDSTIVRIHQHRRPALFGLARVNDFRRAFRAVTDMPYNEFVEEWRRHVNIYYNTMAGQMERVDSLGVRPLRMPGQYVYGLQYSPDTTRIAAVVLVGLDRPVRRLVTFANPGADTLATNVRVLDEGNIDGHISWSPDGARIAYSRLVRGDHGSLINDLFMAETATGRSRRLTFSRRASRPSFSPDGGRLAFVGVERDTGTANIFSLDVQTGEETQLTTFEGDVEITSARWTADGSGVVFARWRDDALRDLASVEIETGEVTALLPAVGDNRQPVLRRDGLALGWTSLDDDVPNAWVSQLGAPADSAERATYLFAGATLLDWLPPDEAHPEGRLVLTASETQRRDRVFVVDARRRPTVPVVPPVIPEAYTTWTTHRPPLEIASLIEPDASLIERRYPYRALSNLTHAVTLALPYWDPGSGDFGAFGMTTFMEPLGKHLISAIAGVSARDPLGGSFAYLSYSNRTLFPTITLNAYRFPSPSRFYGSGVLVERLTGADLSVTTPVNLTDRAYVNSAAGLRVRYALSDPLDVTIDEDADISAGAIPVPEAGTRFDIRAGLTIRHQRPYRHNVIYPLDGSGLRVQLAVAPGRLGGTGRFVEPDASAYWVSPALGPGRFFVYGRGVARFGEALPQDFIGLSRYDGVDLNLPLVGELSFETTERVRGYRRYALGDRLLFGTIEYRLPPVFDLNTNILGAVRLGRISPTLFADAASVWSGSNWDGGTRRLGVGFELKNAISVGPLRFAQALGVAAPYDRAFAGDRTWDDVDLYYRIRASVPF